MSTISDWVNNPGDENHRIAINGGTYKANLNTGGSTSFVDPRWFNSSKNSQQRIKRRKFAKKGWKSFSEPYDNHDPYVLHFKFKKEVRINRMSFELLDYSQKWSFSYYDSYRQKMVPINFPIADKSSNLRGRIKSNTGNWKFFDYDVSKFKTNIIEVRLERSWHKSTSEAAPPAEYSLGLKNLAFKFVSDGTEGVSGDNIMPGPPGFDEIVTYTHFDAFNAIDSSNYPDQVLYIDGTEIIDGEVVDPTETGILDDNTIIPNTNSYWMSAPQGAAESVVALYADVRSEDLSETTFNMIRMLPIQVGPKMSIYYSSDDTVTTFGLSQTKFNIQSFATGSAIPPTRVKDEGYYIGAERGTDELNTYGYYIDNNKMHFDTSKDFTIGVEFKLNQRIVGAGKNAHESLDPRCLWSIVDENETNGFSLMFVPNQGLYVADLSDSPLTSTLQFFIESEKQYGVVVSYNYGGKIPVWNIDISEVDGDISNIQHYSYITDNSSIFAPDPAPASKLLLGNTSVTDKPAYGYIRRIWVKQDSYFSPTSNAFFADAQSFISGDLDKINSRRSVTYNGLAVGDFVNYGTAYLGPNGGFYGNKEWIPIPKDFVLVNTDFDLGQTYKAKYLKFEFTGLMPRWYHTDKPLPVRGFPQNVRAIFDDLYNEEPAGYDNNTVIERFEDPNNNLTPTATHGFTDINSAMRSADPDNFIFQQSLGSYDITRHLPTDITNLRREMSMASTHTKFPIAGRHTYETKWIPAENKKAYFVGVKNLRVFRVTQTQTMDDNEIYDFMDDELQLDLDNSDTNEFDDNLNCYFSKRSTTVFPDEYSATLTTKEFPSYSKFRTIQMATIDSPWQTCMGDDIANLETVDFLEAVNAKTADDDPTYPFQIVTDTYQSQRGGEVVLVERESTELAEYGIATKQLIDVSLGGVVTPNYPGNYSNTDSWPLVGAQTSAAVRMYLPSTGNGTYQLRLWEAEHAITPEWKLAIHKTLTLPPRQWFEEEITYMPTNNNKNWYTEIVQIDPTVSEPFLVDMLGVWQKPVTWEVSNNPDDVTPTWRPVLFSLNNPNAYFSFPFNNYGNFRRLDGVGPNTWNLQVPSPQRWEVDAPLAGDYPEDWYNGAIVNLTVAGIRDLPEIYVTGTLVAPQNTGHYVELNTPIDEGYDGSTAIWHKSSFMGTSRPMRIAVRATVKNPYGGTLVSGYQIIPWYEESPAVNRAPIDYNPPWGVSDSEDLRAISHKPLFQGWYHFFPLHDSTVFQEFPFTKYQY